MFCRERKANNPTYIFAAVELHGEKRVRRGGRREAELPLSVE